MRLIPPVDPVEYPEGTLLGTQAEPEAPNGESDVVLPASVYNTAPGAQPVTANDDAVGDPGSGELSEAIVSDTPSWVSDYLVATGQASGGPPQTVVENPPWLLKHIDDHDPGCPGPEYSDHYCDECSYWQENWKGITFPGGMTQPKSGRGPERGIYGHNSFTNMCGMWCTPDFFSECNFFDQEENQIPLNVIEYSIGYASEMLYKLSGRQYPGLCERLVYPGANRSACQSLTDPYDAKYNRFGSGVGSCCDVGSGCCGSEPDAIRLPRPINNVIEIVIDGEVLPRSAYKISGDNKLIRVDGKSWPKYNDFTRSPFEQIKPELKTSQPKTWFQRWAEDAGFPCENRQDLKVKLNAPDWVNNFLQNHPDLVKGLPTGAPWVRAWLEGNGYEVPAGKIRCADVVNSGYKLTQASGCSSSTIEDACNFILGLEPKVPGAYRWKNDVAYNKVVNDLNKKAPQCSSWAIRYYQGKCAPLSGQLAAAALARDVAKSICVTKCLPDNTARLRAEGFDVQLISRFQSIYPHFPFGIKEVDAFLGATNPNGLMRQGSVHRASGRNKIRTRNLR